jgi:hypothetical protein
MNDPSQQQDTFLQGLDLGLTPTQAAKRANYKDPRNSAKQLMAMPHLSEKIKEIVHKVRKEYALSRADVQRGIMEAIEMARLQADPLVMIRGFQEVNKMCGYYAPEEKRITLTDAQAGGIQQMQTMPLDELINLAEGEIIEAELLDDPEEPKYIEAPDAETV